MGETAGYTSLERTGLDGLNDILKKRFAPDHYIQLEKALLTYHIATRSFKEELPFFIMRVEHLERAVIIKDKDIISSPCPPCIRLTDRSRPEPKSKRGCP